MSLAEPMTEWRLATTSPVSQLSELGNWWFPEFPEEGFRAYKVKIVSFEETLYTLLLNFELAGDLALTKPPRVLQVDLRRSPGLVWLGLPSTVMGAKPNQYAFLMLSDAWANSEGLGQDMSTSRPYPFAEGGGKWPFGAQELLGDKIAKVREGKDGSR